MKFNTLFKDAKPVIGMVHLPPLPASPLWRGQTYDEIFAFALADAKALADGGVDAMIVENQNDQPFVAGEVSPVTTAWMAAITREISRAVSVPVGVNIMFNDWKAEMAAATAGGASFIRVEVLVDPSWSDMGFLDACAPGLLRLRADLRSDVAIFADIQGKYTAPCSPRSLVDSAHDAQHRGLADALIVTGSGTGHSAPIENVRLVKESVTLPVLVGSGVNPNNVAEMLNTA
ncbi:MAG TPA: BtpA/SgcQ family protein, partial [Anaerolineaceae bacterium]|nr:BtpA/SgcQ family protein [Anaerolineaceae bacterium]